MFKHILFIMIAVFAAWALIHVHAPVARAQSNVEVNMDALDDIQDYQPPPMFDAPLTGYDNRRQAIKEFPLEIKTRQNSMNPQFAPNPKVTPPQPTQENITPASMAPVKPVEQVPIYQSSLTGQQPSSLFELPPLPKRKPYLNNASLSQPVSTSGLSDVKSVKTILPPIPKKRPDKLHASQDFIEETMVARQPLEDSLAQPSAMDILASIEEKTVKIPAPAPMEVEATAPTAPTPPTTKASIDVEYSAKQVISFPFRPGATEMDIESRKDFEQQAMYLLKNNPDLRVQVQAYATSFGDGQSSARRLSLTRAISIRSYLIERDIDPKRIDVRALGTQTGTEPLDRVDLVFLDKTEAF